MWKNRISMALATVLSMALAMTWSGVATAGPVPHAAVASIDAAVMTQAHSEQPTCPQSSGPRFCNTDTRPFTVTGESTLENVAMPRHRPKPRPLMIAVLGVNPGYSKPV